MNEAPPGGTQLWRSHITRKIKICCIDVNIWSVSSEPSRVNVRTSGFSGEVEAVQDAVTRPLPVDAGGFRSLRETESRVS